MKKITTLAAAVTIMLPNLVSAQTDALPRLELLPDNAHYSAVSSIDAQVKREAAAPVAKSRFDSYEWIVADGDWQYRSQYTGKTYPTTVRYAIMKQDGQPSGYAYIEMTNDLFGTAYLHTNTVTGDTNSVYDLDDTGENIYPRLRDNNGTPLDMTFNVNYIANTPVYGTWASYPLSGNGRLMTRILPIIDNDIDYTNEVISNDCLYDAQAPDCKIKADYARGYYRGEKKAHVSLQRGEGVTDVYYIMGNEIIDEKRTLADTTWTEGWSYYRVRRGFADEYIAEFKAGETNEAYTVGHVGDNAGEFDIPLPDCDGMRQMMIVACNGDCITDMVFDMIEIRRPTQWEKYGTVEITHDMVWFDSNAPFNEIEAGDYTVEANDDYTMLRIVNPFATAGNPDANYLYINASLGLDFCYIEPSYAPFNLCYEYKAYDGSDQTLTRPYLMEDIISINMLRGFKPQSFTSDQSMFIDLSSGTGSDWAVVAKDYNFMLYDEWMGGNYINHSASGSVGMKLHSAVVASPDVKGVNFEVGSAVDYLVCSFGYDTAADVRRAAVAAADTPAFHINVDNGKANIDIHSLLKNNELPQSPTRIYYTAYDGSNNILRSGELDLTGYTFTKEVSDGNVTYTGGSNGVFTDARLLITRDDNKETGISVYTVEKFGSTLKYADPDISISFETDNNRLVKAPADFFIATLNFGGDYGNLDVYAHFGDINYVKTSGGSELTGELICMCYNQETHEAIGYYDYAQFTIHIPEELSYDFSSVEITENDTERNSVPVYYNLQGIRIDNPSPGSLLIEVKGNASRKIIFN